MTRIRAVVAGGSGYIGAELIRLLLRHPRVELVGRDLRAAGRGARWIGATRISAD